MAPSFRYASWEPVGCSGTEWELGHSSTLMPAKSDSVAQHQLNLEALADQGQ